MPKIILCRGIQGSGKTTWAKQWVLEDPEHRVRFNNDDIRNMLGKYWVPDREVLVSALKTQFIITSMKKGYDIVIDNMNLNSKEVEYYELYIKSHNQVVDELKSENRLNPKDVSSMNWDSETSLFLFKTVLREIPKDLIP